MTAPKQEPLRTFVAYVEDQPGVLNRIASLFRRRNFNIVSLNVGRTHEAGISRMTVVVEADDDKARRIVASVLALGRTLDIDLVAEGVEDERTATVLRDLGCPLAQGWYFSAAIGAQAMRDVLGARLAASAVRS